MSRRLFLKQPSISTLFSTTTATTCLILFYSSEFTHCEAEKETVVGKKNKRRSIDDKLYIRNITKDKTYRNTTTTATAANIALLKKQNSDNNMIKRKNSTRSFQNTFVSSVAMSIGKMNRMEDRVTLSSDGDFSGVYDGHGGCDVSTYLEKHLYQEWKHSLEEQGEMLGGMKDRVYTVG